MVRFVSILFLTSCCVLLVHCTRETHEDVVKVERNAARAVSAAQDEATDQRARSAKTIQDQRAQGNLKNLEAAKVEATTEIATAEGKVDGQKIAATKDVTKAQRKAGETSGTFQHH